MTRCYVCKKKIPLAMSVAFSCKTCNATLCSSGCHSGHSTKCSDEALNAEKQMHEDKLLKSATSQAKLEKL
jgi:hypothetical protein